MSKPTAFESAYMGRVAELGCLICEQPAEVHHLREGVGMGQRASNFLVVPLCPTHHRQDAFSIHGGQSRAFKNLHGDELALLAMTIERLHKREMGL